MKFPVEPLVSCIIPTKDRPDLLVRAINSVLGQSYRKIEVIVIDDSTNSFTQQKLAQSGLSIKYLKNDQPRGASYSRNVGLTEAKGDVISFLDDDDFWMPRKIEAQLPLIHQYPLVSCNCISTIKGRKIFISYPKYVTSESMLYYNFLGSCSFVILDSSITKECFFDEDLKCGQDWDMWLSIMAKNNIAEAINVGDFLVYYNLGNYPRITNTVHRTPEVMSIYAKHQDRYSPFSTEMFGLYNMVSTNDSRLLRLLQGLTIAKRQNKGLVFFLQTIIKRLFGHIVIY